MTLTMNCLIEFPEHEGRAAFSIRKVHRIEIESSWKLLTDRARIELPRNVKDFEKEKVREVFRRGAPVVIYFGYNGTLIEQFRGYITQVSADIPIVIKCEDEMWRVKQLPVNLSYKNVLLDELLKAIAPGYEVDALEGVQLGGVRFSKTTAGKVLEKLQQEWNLYSYMEGSTLKCGKYYADDTEEKPVNFDLERNAVSNDLNYKKKEDILIKIRAVSTLSNGNKLEVIVGDENGEERQLSYYNIRIKGELEVLATKDLEKHKRDGFDGSFTAFGIPSVRHGLKVKLTSSLYEDRSGLYYIDSVNKQYSSEGIRQDIQLGDLAK